jgi:predicted N-acetyltransferase YhbS
MSDAALEIRTFRDGDERSLAEIFNHHVSAFVGPASVTPQSWRAQYGESWRAPLLGKDRESFRVAERAGQIVGYAICECPCQMMPEVAVIQELSVADLDDADDIARALVADAEARARQKGVPAIILHTSDEDGLTCRVADALGYQWPEETTGVFMAAITNLTGFLTEMEPELSRRLAASVHREWDGRLLIRSGESYAGVRMQQGRVQIDEDWDAQVAITVCPDALPLLLLGRVSVGPLYLQDEVVLQADDKPAALELLDTLFPRLPMYLPRSQWW